MKIGTGQLTTFEPKKLYDTFSFCSNCLNIVPSKVIGVDNKVYLYKECESCDRKTLILLENDINFFNDNYEYYEKFYKKYLSLAKLTFDKVKVNNNYSSISIVVTDRCNLNCPVCFRSEFIREDLSFNIIKKLLPRVKGKWITITGGEPTIREDLQSIINLAVKTSNIPILQTNGIRLEDFNYAKSLKEAGLKYIHLSFNGLDERIYEKTYGDKNIFKKKMIALENMKKLGLKVLLSMVIVDDMKNEISDVINFAIQNNDFIKGIFIRPMECTDSNLNYNLKNSYTMSDVAKIIEESTENKIKVIDFIEYKKFRWNLYRLFLKIFGEKIAEKIYPEVPLETLLIKKGNHQYDSIFNGEELSEINKTITKLIEEKILTFNSLKSIVKLSKFILNKNRFPIALNLIKNKFKTSKVASDIFDNSKILRLWIDKVYLLQNIDLKINVKTYTLSSEKPDCIMARYN